METVLLGILDLLPWLLFANTDCFPSQLIHTPHFFISSRVASSDKSWKYQILAFPGSLEAKDGHKSQFWPMKGKRKTILEMSGDNFLPVKRMSIVPVDMVVWGHDFFNYGNHSSTSKDQEPLMRLKKQKDKGSLVSCSIFQLMNQSGTFTLLLWDSESCYWGF